MSGGWIVSGPAFFLLQNYPIVIDIQAISPVARQELITASGSL